MNNSRNFTRYTLIILLLSPWFIECTPYSVQDAYSLEAVVGKGAYSHKSGPGCDNENLRNHITDVHYEDVSVALERHLHNFRFGVKTDFLHVDTYVDRVDTRGREYYSPATSSFALTPSVGIEYKYFGIDIGAAFVDKQIASESPMPSVALRIGNEQTFFLTASLFHNAPLASGGGIGEMGAGFAIDKFHCWGGVCGVPYISAAASIKTEYDLSDKTSVRLCGQYGKDELTGYGSSNEYGVSMGIKFLFPGNDATGARAPEVPAGKTESEK